MSAKVLLMARDDSYRHMMLRALEEKGFAVRTAAVPEELLAGLTDWEPDVAVLDLSSPETDAMDLLWRIATTDRPVPVLISHGPRGWGRRLTAWLSRGFVPHATDTRRLLDAVSAAIRSCAGATLLPVA